MGRIGTGKTTVARQLASELDWPVFSSDQIRKTLGGVPLTIRTAPELRAKVYSGQMTKQTYQKLLENGLAAVPSHGGVILDATFSSRRKRDLLRDECAKAGVPLQVIELEAADQEIVKRLKARGATVAEMSDARLEDLETERRIRGAIGSGRLDQNLNGDGCRIQLERCCCAWRKSSQR